MNARDEADRRRREEAEASLRRASESTAIGDTALSGMAKRAGDHFSGADGADPVEIWGKRIGRIAALVVVIVLIYWLARSLSAR